MSSKPVPPSSANSDIHHWLLNLRQAMDDGDTNPHLVMRDIVGEVYARGYTDGYTASLFDRPLNSSPTATTDKVKTALLDAADEMEAVIADGDCAEVAAPVPGEVGRSAVLDKRDALYEDPVTWLREYASAYPTAARQAPARTNTEPEEQDHA